MDVFYERFVDLSTTLLNSLDVPHHSRSHSIDDFVFLNVNSRACLKNFGRLELLLG